MNITRTVSHREERLGLYPHTLEARQAAHYAATPTALGRHAPKLDEHTDEILAELGHDTDSIAALRARGIVGARR